MIHVILYTDSLSEAMLFRFMKLESACQICPDRVFGSSIDSGRHGTATYKVLREFILRQAHEVFR